MKNSIYHSDPEIMSGANVFIGTRVPIKILFDYLESGDCLDAFLKDFPSVKKDQASQLIAFARKNLTQDFKNDNNKENDEEKAVA